MSGSEIEAELSSQIDLRREVRWLRWELKWYQPRLQCQGDGSLYFWQTEPVGSVSGGAITVIAQEKKSKAEQPRELQWIFCLPSPLGP